MHRPFTCDWGSKFNFGRDKERKTVSNQVKKKTMKFQWSSVYIYLIPWFIGLLIFRVYPFIEAFRISMFNRRIGRPEEFVGLANFNEILFENTMHGNLFRDSMWTTFRYVLLTVPLVLVVALFVAFILNFKIKGIGFFRTAYYIPSILGGSVSIALLWRQVFGDQGLINSFIGIFGIEPVGWMTQTNTALLVMALLRAWQFGSVMLIFLSALQNVPLSLYEAASIDGAKKWRQFFSVTIPIITPTILFNTVQLLVAAFQEFNAPFLVFPQPGGPNNAALLMNVFVYMRAFEMNNFGLSAAASWIMFIIIMIATLIIFKFSNKWVFYND
jgi:oligogalacturonide transport system permease protein